MRMDEDKPPVLVELPPRLPTTSTSQSNLVSGIRKTKGVSYKKITAYIVVPCVAVVVLVNSALWWRDIRIAEEKRRAYLERFDTNGDGKVPENESKAVLAVEAKRAAAERRQEEADSAAAKKKKQEILDSLGKGLHWLLEDMPRY
jgi:hypothetical protein